MKNNSADKTIRILLIEEDSGDCILFKNCLNEIDGLAFRLIIAHSFDEAKKSILENEFNIIFSDLNLPESFGINTLKNLLALGLKAPIIVITRNDNRDMGLEAIRNGAHDFLPITDLSNYLLEKTILYTLKHKHLESQLHESENKFRHIFDNSSIGIFRSTNNGHLIEVNKAFADIFGYESPDEIRKHVTDISKQLYVNPVLRDEIMGDFKNFGIKYNQIEVEFYKRDGSIFTGLVHIRRSKNSIGKNFILEGDVQDITKQKLTTEKLENNLKFLRDLMDSIPSPIFAKDKNLRYTGCNKEFERYIGCSEKELLGKTIMDLRSGELAEPLYQKDHELLLKKEHQIFEHKVKFASGEERDVVFHKNVIENQNGDVSGIIGILLDVTDKKHTLNKLREELSLNKAMTELSKQLLKPGISFQKVSDLVIEFAKEITTSEQGFAGIIDPLTSELIIHFPSSMYKDESGPTGKIPKFSKTNDGYPNLWGHSLNTKKAFYTNNPELHEESGGVPIGHFKVTNFLSVPAIVDNKLVGQVALANSAQPFNENDLEGVKKLTNLYSLAIQKLRNVQELISAKDIAEQSDKLKSAFLANMSHEIRTPLNAIVGFAQMLGEEGIEEDETREFKDVIINNTDILLRLINDIIEMSMIEAGEIKIHSEVRSISQTLDQIFMIWENSDELSKTEGKINFEFAAPEDVGNKAFKIDDLRFNQITNNLLLNAFRFTEEGTITLGYYFEENNVVIYVRDTGVGISEEYQKTIFERFRQVDELRVRPFSGTGLGLAITKKLVEHLSGKIRIESEPGKGSTFYISFPLAGGKSIAKPRAEVMFTEPMPITSFEGRKLLIVEDNDASYELLDIILKRGGAIITRATTGVEAVEETLRNKNDIILMDLQLPEMSGFEAIRQIRLINKTIPIIVQTAFSESNERDKAFEAGCNEYLVKPITKNKLEAAISKFC